MSKTTISQSGTSQQLVYLDTWTLSTLGQTLRKDSERFMLFVDVWRRTGSILGLSRTHLIELRRHRDAKVRAARYEVLEALLPARFDMLLNSEQPALNVLADREIGVQILHHLGRGAILDAVDRYWIGFPLWISDAADLAVVREQLESDTLGSAFDLFHDALAMESDTRTRDSGTSYERVRLHEVPDYRPTDAEVAQAMEAIQQMKATPLWESMRSLLSPENLAHGEAVARAQMSAFLSRAQEVGFRETLRERDVHAQSRQNEFFDTHLQNCSFFDSVRSVVAALSGVKDSQLIDLVTHGVTRARCPGIWLKDAVDLELRRAKHRPEPNDWFDLDHLTHLLYVDLQFTDHEISSVTRQVLNRRGLLPDALASVALPVSTKASLEAVEGHLVRAAGVNSNLSDM